MSRLEFLSLIRYNTAKYFFLSFSILYCFISRSQVNAEKGDKYGSSGYVFKIKEGKFAVTPTELFADPELFLMLWSNEVIPSSAYSAQEKKVQREINDQEDLIQTLNPISDRVTFNNKKAIKQLRGKDIDYEEITPYTWKWITLEQVKENGDTTIVKLRRPNWCLNKQSASVIAKKISLSLPEMGFAGEFTLKKIVPSQFDSRFHSDPDTGLYKFRPITGWFCHISSDVWNYYFSGTNEVIGVTSTHPFYSLDRNAYIPASDLKPSERVKTEKGEAVFLRRVKKEGREKVYNLEIWRDHNFMVGNEGLLVHNSCGQGFVSLFNKIQGPGYAQFKQIIESLPDGFLYSLSQLNSANITSFLTKFKNDNTLFNAFKIDILNPVFQNWAKQNTGRIDLWEIAQKAGSKYVKLNPTYLDKLALLSDNVRSYAVKFTDAGAGSTLTKFLDDCTPDFVTFLNAAENEVYVKGMLAHKNVNLTLEESELIAELIDNADGSKVYKWLSRSENVTKFQNITGLGRSFGIKITAALKDPNSPLFQLLKNKLNISDLHLYEVLTEVPLTTPDGFMKADVVLLKRNAVTQKIQDVVIIENKLSKSTDFTLRQKEGWRKIKAGDKMKVKYDRPGIAKDVELEIFQNKCLKISDHGADNISTLTSSDIDFINFLNY